MGFLEGSGCGWTQEYYPPNQQTGVITTSEVCGKRIEKETATERDRKREDKDMRFATYTN